MLRSTVYLISTFFLLLGSAYAQEQTGGISGKITDGSTGEPMVRATVIIEGTKRGGFSDAKGRYTIKNIPAGKYNVRATFMGYQPKVVKDVDIKAGQTATLNFVLQMDKKQTKEVVVEARGIKESQGAVLAERKNAATVSDGVSAEEIKKAPDSDAGQALKRVSGVTLVGDKFVYVRGISDRYNNTTLNGVAVTSTEPDKKAFAFDMFPTEFLQNASVTKSFTPDLPGNFAGGLVQLNTVDFPQGYSLKVSTSGSYNDNVTGKNGRFNTYTGGSSDWLGFDNGARTMPGLLPSSRNEMDKLQADIRQFYAGNKTPEYTAAADRWVGMAQQYNPSLWNRQSATAAPNGSFGVSFTNLYTPFDNDLGVIASVNYSNGVSIANRERRGISATQEELFFTSGTVSNRSTNLGAMLNLSTKLGDGNTISFRNLYNNSSDDDVVMLDGYNVAQTRDLRYLSMDYTQKALYSSQLIGEHVLSSLGNMVVDWRVGYSTTTRDQPDFRRLRYSRDQGATDQQYIADIPVLQQGDGTLAGRFRSYLNDDALNASLNLVIPIETFKVKVGGLAEDRNRTFNTRSFTYIQSRIFSRGQSPSDSILAGTPDQIFSRENFGPDGLGVSEDSKPTDSYTANERLYAAFAMVDMPFTIGDEEFRFITGARVEDNTTRLETPASYKPGTSTPDSIIKTNLHTFDVLPSLNLVYKINDQTNIRMSASQTLARPSLREFAPFAFFDFQDLAVVRGNKDLTRALIQNYDLRYELFPGFAQVFSAGVFYKVFQNAIEETIVPVASEIERSFQNASGVARNYGFELEARKHFGFIDEYLQSLLLSVNYSWVRSEVEVQQGLVTDKRALWGQSPYSLNIGLFFAEPEWKTQFNISYNVSGKRIIQVGQLGRFEFADPHVYELPRDVIDISVSQPIGESLNIRFTVRDLLNQALRWQQGNTIVMSQVRGSTMGLSVSYTLR